MKLLILIQARSGSKRLPGKIFEKIGPRELIRWSYDAARAAQEELSKQNLSSRVKIACPNLDTTLIQFCEQNLLGYTAPICDENDVIKRLLLAAKEAEATAMIRITADCWQINPAHIEEVGKMLLKGSDYVSNTIHRSFVEGLDIQGCSIRALEWFNENQKEKREHPFVDFDNNEMIRESFEKEGMNYLEFIHPRAMWTIKTSIDSAEDLERARKIYEKYEEDRRAMERAKQERISAGPNRDELKAAESIR